MRKVFFPLIALCLASTIMTAVQTAAAQPGRTLQDVREETFQRNQPYSNPRNDPYARGQNSSKTTANRSLPTETIKAAFRKAILTTMTEQDLKVTRVIDGDTLEVSVEDKRSTLHLIGVDAPEEGQPGWEEAKNKLSDLVLGKTVTIQYSTFCPKHTSGVFLTHVVLDGNDVGTYLLENGWAWYDENYSVFFEQKKHKEKINIVKSARTAKLGIWKNETPVEPWDYAAAKSKKTP